MSDKSEWGPGLAEMRRYFQFQDPTSYVTAFSMVSLILEIEARLTALESRVPKHTVELRALSDEENAAYERGRREERRLIADEMLKLCLKWDARGLKTAIRKWAEAQYTTPEQG